MPRPVVIVDPLMKPLRNPTILLPEEQVVTTREGCVPVWSGGFRGEEPDAAGRGIAQVRLPREVLDTIHLRPIVKTRAAPRLLIHLEPEWMNQMKPALRGHAGAADVPGVVRDLRLEEHHMEQRRGAIGWRSWCGWCGVSSHGGYSRRMLTIVLGDGFLSCACSISLVMAAAPRGPVAAASAQRGTDAAIVLTEGAAADPAWRSVADWLSKDQGAEIIEWKAGATDAVVAKLAATAPRFTTFIATPAEAGRVRVREIHQLTRRLDADPWCDTRWGIITGRTAGDAMRQAQFKGPLAVNRGFGGTGIPLENFAEGVWFNEGVAGQCTTKARDGTVSTTVGATDTTEALVDAFNTVHPDFVMTSGHATERDWQIGYSFPAGALVPRDGGVVGVDRARGVHAIQSPNPKVFLAAGNCLMGHVDGPDALALAWMGESAGVRQFVGYTVKTWSGQGGWGTKDWFFSDPGRYSLNEAFWLNNQSILADLEAAGVGLSRAEVPGFDDDSPNQALASVARSMREASSDVSRDSVMARAGRLWDRDGVAFYGRPDVDARLARTGRVWDSEVDDRGAVIRATVFAPSAVTFSTPPALFLPRRIEKFTVLDHAGLPNAIIADDFVIFRGLTELKEGERRTIVLRDDSASERPRRSAPAWPDLLALASKFSAAYRGELVKALSVAEDNQGEIAEFLNGALALGASDPLALDAAAYLVAYMPERDLTTLRAEYLREHLDYALRTRRESRWSKDVPVEVWLDAVLPYANVNERRDAWRRDYYERYFQLTQAADSLAGVVEGLNKQLFTSEGVTYHATKRPKSNQSPFESRDAGYASCTGLSVMLANALRTGGIPARLAGTPLWLEKTGNHTWVEVWDGAQWRPVEAFSQAAFEKPWWAAQTAGLSRANLADPLHRIYAARWKRGTTPFVQAWDIDDRSVAGEDVTSLYGGYWPEPDAGAASGGASGAAGGTAGGAQCPAPTP